MNLGLVINTLLKILLEKRHETREMIDRSNKDIFLEVDGGIDRNTARLVIEAGANVLVAGTAIFKAESIQKGISELRTA